MELTQTLERRPVFPMIMSFARLEVGALGRRAAQAFGFQRPRHIDIEDIRIPDTQIVREATELVESCSPQFLVNHCFRSYFFGVAVGRHLKLDPDLELLFLSCIMHDLGVTESYDSDGSFELNGARAAHEFLLAHEVPTDKAALVHESIALHSSVGIAHKREPEIALLHYGAGVDVIGFRIEAIAPQARDAIVERYPRLQLKDKFGAMVVDQAARKPTCHIEGHVGLGFRKKMQMAPFAE